MASESVLSSLIPIGLNELSRRIGVDPFETVRLLVAVGHDLSGPMRFAPELVEVLRERGGVDPSWWRDAGAASPRERVQAAVKGMLERGIVGDTTTRMDNVWRGLPFEDQGLLQQAISVLAEDGVLRCVGTATGLQVSVAAEQKATAEAIAAGSATTPGLDALLGG